MAKENKNKIGEMRIPTDELIKEYQEKYGDHDPRAPKWARELMENLTKNG
jgi:hypothetical protein